VLHGWRDEAVRAGRTITRIALAFEAGRDGFWSIDIDDEQRRPLAFREGGTRSSNPASSSGESSAFGRLGEGFRMPASGDLSTRTEAGVRKPPNPVWVGRGETGDTTHYPTR
jgi:hypothetical protein